MTKATFDAERPAPLRLTSARPMRLQRRGVASAVGALFRLAVKQQCRAQRMFVVSLLFVLPVALAVVARVYNADFFQADKVETLLVFYFIPHALVPLTALLYAPAMIQDEIEEQTLTYLITRPLPKWTIYLGKLLATIVVTSLMVSVFTVATYVAIYAGSDSFWGDIFPVRALKTSALVALALVAYSSLFGCLSVFVRRTLVIGVAYIIVLEGVVANIPFLVRQLTVMYYFRVLSMRWLDSRAGEWSIDLDSAPDAQTCLLTLVAASLVATVLATVIFSMREFRMKTPEGS